MFVSARSFILPSVTHAQQIVVCNSLFTPPIVVKETSYYILKSRGDPAKNRFSMADPGGRGRVATCHPPLNSKLIGKHLMKQLT